MKNFNFYSIKIVSLILFLLSVSGTLAQTPNAPVLTPKQIAQRTLPSIVMLIMNNGDERPITTGSGFFVSEDTIVTNYHVVKNAKLGAIKIYGNNEVSSIIGTVGIDLKNDLALLKIQGVKGKPLKLNSTTQLSIGDEIFTLSSPKGLEGTFSQGLISGLRKTSNEDLIQITAPISHGSSGGAILDNQAEVIAVAVGGINEGQSLNFAIPVKYVQFLMTKRTALAALPGSLTYSDRSEITSSRSNGIVSGGGQGTGSGLRIESSETNASRYIEQIQSQLEDMETFLYARDYRKTHNYGIDKVTQYGRGSYTFILQKGWQYVLFSVCDADCSDIDITVFDENNRQVARDNDADDNPMITISPKLTGKFRIVVDMYKCINSPCYYGIGVMGR